MLEAADPVDSGLPVQPRLTAAEVVKLPVLRGLPIVFGVDLLPDEPLALGDL